MLTLETIFKNNYLDYTLTISRHWGETGAGVLTLIIADFSDEKMTTSIPDKTKTVALGFNFEIKSIYGNKITADNLYRCNHKFASFSNLNNHRKLSLMVMVALIQLTFQP